MNEEIVNLSSSEDDEECNQRRANSLTVRLLRDYYGPFLHQDDNLDQIFVHSALNAIRNMYEVLRKHKDGIAMQSLDQLGFMEGSLLNFMSHYNSSLQIKPKIEPPDVTSTQSQIEILRADRPWRKPRRLRPAEQRKCDTRTRNYKREPQDLYPAEVPPPKTSRWNHSGLSPMTAGQQAPPVYYIALGGFVPQNLQPPIFAQAMSYPPPHTAPFVNQNAFNYASTSNFALPQENSFVENRINHPPPTILHDPRKFNNQPPPKVPSTYREHRFANEARNNPNNRNNYNDRSNGGNPGPKQRNFSNQRDPRNFSRFDKRRIESAVSSHSTTKPSSETNALNKNETRKTATKQPELPRHSKSSKTPQDLYHPEVVTMSAPASTPSNRPPHDTQTSGVDSGLESPANLSTAGDVAMHSQETPSNQLLSSVPSNPGPVLPEPIIVETSPQTPVPSALPVPKSSATNSLPRSNGSCVEPSSSATVDIHRQPIDAIIPPSVIKQEMDVEESAPSQENYQDEVQIKVEFKEECYDGETESNADSDEDTEPEDDEVQSTVWPTGVDAAVDDSPPDSAEVTNYNALSESQILHNEVVIVKQEVLDEEEVQKKDLIEKKKIALKCRKFEELSRNTPIALALPTINLWDRTVCHEVNNNYETPSSPLDNDENWERPPEEEDFDQQIEPSQPPSEDDDFTIQPLEPSEPPPVDTKYFAIQPLEPKQPSKSLVKSRTKKTKKPKPSTGKKKGRK